MKILDYRILYSNIKDPIMFKKLRWEHVLSIFNILITVVFFLFYYQKKRAQIDFYNKTHQKCWSLQ